VELTKLIEQCCEEKGLPSFMVKGLIKEVENEKGNWLNTLLEWLASRPTCGENYMFTDVSDWEKTTNVKADESFKLGFVTGRATWG